jgi:hypothetical protein
MKKKGLIVGCLIFGSLSTFKIYKDHKYDNEPIKIQIHMVRHGQTHENLLGI